MFSAASRGIPSFGDLSWKRPVDFVTDVSLSWNFPVPTRSPVGAPVPGQTLTKNGNGALSAEPCMNGTVLSVGDRLLVAATDPGIWIVTALGSAGTPWVLTRATDADTTAKLPTGTITTASDFALDGGLFSAARAFFAYDGSVFELLPNVATQFSVLNDAFFGVLGATDPAVDVNGRLNSDTVSVEGPVYADTVTLNNTNRDVRMQRSAAKTLKADDGAGGALTLLDLISAPISGKRPVRQVYTANATWNKPANIHHIEVECQGSGGGGGASPATGATTTAGGGGGGGGGYAKKLFTSADLASDSTYDIVIGNGGAGGAAGNNAGSAGGNATFAGTGITTVAGNGGGGGESGAATSGTSLRDGGAGGTATGGDINVNGSDGGLFFLDAGRKTVGGYGGSSFMGGMTSQTSTDAGGAGSAGKQYGGGGSGAQAGNSQAAFAGGTGAKGVVIVTEYYGP